MIRLAIAEDHQSLIDGLKLQLDKNDDMQIVGVANDGEALLEVVRRKVPDIVITDIRMPKIDGITAVKLIKKEFPDIKVLAFTMFNQDDAILRMIAAGASGYILKNSSLAQVIDAIKTVAKGERYLDGNISTDLSDQPIKIKNKGILTKRQKEILEYIAQGKTSRHIADQLFIEVSTVETHRKNMINILGLKGSGELLRYAIEKKYDFD